MNAEKRQSPRLKKSKISLRLRFRKKHVKNREDINSGSFNLHGMSYMFANHIVTQVLGSIIEAWICYILSRKSSRFKEKARVWVSGVGTKGKGPYSDWTSRTAGQRYDGLWERSAFFEHFISKWKMRRLMTAWRSHSPLYLWSTDLHDLDVYVEEKTIRRPVVLTGFSFSISIFSWERWSAGRSHWILILISICVWSRNVYKGLTCCSSFAFFCFIIFVLFFVFFFFVLLFFVVIFFLVFLFSCFLIFFICFIFCFVFSSASILFCFVFLVLNFQNIFPYFWRKITFSSSFSKSQHKSAHLFLWECSATILGRSCLLIIA